MTHKFIIDILYLDNQIKIYSMQVNSYNPEQLKMWEVFSKTYAESIQKNPSVFAFTLCNMLRI